MKLIWEFVVVVIIIKVTSATNVFLEKEVMKSNFSKLSKPPLYIITKKRIFDLFPSMPNKGNNFKVNLNSKPPSEIYIQTTKPEQLKKLLMPKILITDINYTGDDTVKVEVTTRRSLMQKRKFTVRPHDDYAESIREKYNWNSNNKIVNYNSRIPNRKLNIVKPNSKTIKEEARFLNLKSGGVSLNDSGHNDFEKPNNENGYVVADSNKANTNLLFPKRNKTKYFKLNPQKIISEKLQINNLYSESKVPSNVLNNDKYEREIIEEKENIKVTPNVLIQPDFKDIHDEIIEPRENFSDQEKKDYDEFICVKGINKLPLLEPSRDDDEMTTDNDIEYLVSRPERSVNIIEEESVATTFAGIKITNQEYPIIHDLTFKNIHT